MTVPSTAQDLAELAAQEERLVFDVFDHDTAWQLGSRLREAAVAAGLPVVIAISRGGQRLFHTALPGTVPDNDSWVDRKTAVVLRFGHSSLYMGTSARADGTTFEDRYGLPLDEYAAHGGGFPVTVRGAGIVGAIVVSGLPQVEDHAFLVQHLAAFLQTAIA